MNKAFSSALLAIGICSSWAPAPTMAQGSTALQADVSVDNATAVYRYSPTTPEAIMVSMSLVNATAGEIFTSAGFSARRFYLNLAFTDQQGKTITARDLSQLYGGQEPPPPLVVPIGDEMVQVEAVEGLAAGWNIHFDPFNAYDYYTLRPGKFTMRADIHARFVAPGNVLTIDGKAYATIAPGPGDATAVLTSSTVPLCIQQDEDRDGYFTPACAAGEKADCNDADAGINPGATETGTGKDEDCNPATPVVVRAPGGKLILKADLHTVGSGVRPPTTKTPIPGMTVRVFDKSSTSCVRKNFGVSWQNYRDIWLSNCRDTAYGATGISGNTQGIAQIDVPTGDYLAIGEFDPEKGTRGDELYVGVSVGGVAAGQNLDKFLQVIQKSDGKKIPAKYTVLTGSLLMIIEPEYIEWDGTVETYPFVFESLGDWSVTTAIKPPEGFVADYPFLSETVADSVAAVQFTITDVGSEWVPTVATHTIKHKGKVKTIKSDIGVKLSEKLAKAKGLSRFGKKQSARW